jgi:GNAT superfamily N-acetyltransferase
MKYSQIDSKTASKTVLYNISKWHNETPRLWIEGYEPSEDDIKETMTRMIDNESYIGIVEDKSIKGFIWAEKQEEDVMIMSLFVDESVRQSNLGTSLKEALETWCKMNGIKKIKTTVHSKNKKMISLNEKLGYESKMLHMEKIL